MPSCPSNVDPIPKKKSKGASANLLSFLHDKNTSFSDSSQARVSVTEEEYVRNMQGHLDDWQKRWDCMTIKNSDDDKKKTDEGNDDRAKTG